MHRVGLYKRLPDGEETRITAAINRTCDKLTRWQARSSSTERFRETKERISRIIFREFNEGKDRARGRTRCV
jgi:hypothetical protein